MVPVESFCYAEGLKTGSPKIASGQKITAGTFLSFILRVGVGEWVYCICLYAKRDILDLSVKGIFCIKLDNLQSSVHPSRQRRLDSQPADVDGEVLQVRNHSFVSTRHSPAFLATFSCRIILFSEVLMLLRDC